jgi:V-type H+-transporting ATPase subunit E
MAFSYALACALQVAFIKQEALEKAREVRVKADEEFAIDKVL